MPSTALFGLQLRLGPDDTVDRLPRQVDEPNVFVPSHYEYLSHALRLFFPSADVPDQRVAFDVRNQDALWWMEEEDVSDGHMSEGRCNSSALEPTGRSTKRLREEDESGEVFQLACELVYSQVEGEAVLGTIQAGIEPTYYDALALVALIRTSNDGDTSIPGETAHEGRLISAAWSQTRRGQTSLDDARCGREWGIVLGHVLPHRIKHSHHPLNHLHPLLLRHGWITLSNCIVTLNAPFLPAEDVIGPTSSHPIGRAVPTSRGQTDFAASGMVWRDPVTKQVWNSCPRRLLPAAELFGSVHFQVDLMDEALEYGGREEHDGFVDVVAVPRRHLALSAKLKQLIPDTLEFKESLIESVVDLDDYWARTPRRYYDGDPESLSSDNRIETALEATRPRRQSTMLEANGSIKTTLMPFQKKALAWMVTKEVHVRDDEGALLPHWIRLRSKKIAPGKPGDKRARVETERSVNEFFMDTTTGTLSRRRFTSRQSEPGGCLCDAMGLGKSLTTLSLIATHPRPPSYVDQSRSAQIASGLAENLRPFVSTSTLLVVPSSLVHQWYSEIRKHLAVEASEKHTGYVRRYQRDVSIPWTANDERLEIRTRAKDLLTGEGQAVVVLATYEDLRVELRISKRSKRAISPLLDIHWWRVVLDEAQLVSTSNGSAAEMVNCLWRTNGWIITSTPFNSSIRDMHGLLTFLDSDFASRKLFDELIAVPFAEGDAVGMERAHGVLKRIMWRHRKEHVEDELCLPPSTMQTLLLEKSGLEKSLYDREYKHMLDIVISAVGLGRSLTKKQQDRLLSLRRLISHPQLASSLGYGGPGALRTTFANLFADLIFRNQGELHGAHMEFITVVIKLAAGERFRLEEKVAAMWKGGTLRITKAVLKEKLLVAREYARQGAAREVAFQSEATLQGRSREGTQGHHEGERCELARQNGETEKGGAPADVPATASEHTIESPRTSAPISMRFEEALHWIEGLLSSKADLTLPTGAVDPERLTNLFFERRVVEADSVDIDDARFHPILLDAGDEEEEVEESAPAPEAVLLKNRFRGTSRRSVKKVWYYHPRRKLQSLCRDVPPLEDRITRLQGEGNYLGNRIREELGEERARLVMKDGFDALKAGSGAAERKSESQCLLCLDQIDTPGILPCLHSACFACLIDCAKRIGLGGKTPCPMCRQPFEKREIIEVLPAMAESDHANEYGVKITGLIAHIRTHLEVDAHCKIVIFSAWSTYLGYVAEALNSLSKPIRSVAFSGKDQSSALQAFQADDEVRIILVPMKMAEGAAGLTLNTASLAYLLEPSLDSALEDQALGRLNRIGQKAEKTTYFRVLVKNTIEPALVQVAERRLKERTDSEADTRHHDSLSVAELAFVFGLDVGEEKARKKEEMRSRPLRRAARQSDVVEAEDLDAM